MGKDKPASQFHISDQHHPGQDAGSVGVAYQVFINYRFSIPDRQKVRPKRPTRLSPVLNILHGWQ